MASLPNVLGYSNFEISLTLQQLWRDSMFSQGALPFHLPLPRWHRPLHDILRLQELFRGWSFCRFKRHHRSQHILQGFELPSSNIPLTSLRRLTPTHVPHTLMQTPELRRADALKVGDP